MGKITAYAKWDLQNGIWVPNPDTRQYGKSFAIANYDKIINSNEKVDYIIFGHGSRVENFSKNYLDINEKKQE